MILIARRVFWCLYLEVPISKALLWSLRKLEVTQLSMIQHQVLFNVLKLSSSSPDGIQNCELLWKWGLLIGSMKIQGSPN